MEKFPSLAVVAIVVVNLIARVWLCTGLLQPGEDEEGCSVDSWVQAFVSQPDTWSSSEVCTHKNEYVPSGSPS